MSNTEMDRDNHLVKKALLELRRMRTRLESEQRMRSEPIAIVGTACRFAGGTESTEAFFELLRNGVDTIREIPRDRWDIDAYYDSDPGAKGKMYVRHGGFLDQVDLFDPEFFGISGREALTLDPQQRLLLEMAWEALENAGVAATALRGGRTGVYFSAMNTDYMQVTHDADAVDVHTSTGTMSAVAAGRLAYVLGLQGPAMMVDTACSSALVAVHLACHSLRRRECDLVVAGGVNLMLAPHMMVIECTTHMLAKDGRCKTFDAAANGFGRGEGGGMVVLKRLSDAKASGDNIIAVIRGSAVNHDGRSSGLSVPNGLAQESVIREALKDAGVEAADIDYVEAHGTGTKLGDPIEIGALHSAVGRGRASDNPLLVGSVKTNLGHLEWAAGIAGLLKTALALQHKEIPPHIHLRELNPLIVWEGMNIQVPTRCHPWPQNGSRLAGVSSFGLSGTNAHVILEEAPPIERDPVLERGAELLVLSGKNEAALSEQIKRYRAHLTQQGALALGDICYTAGAGRSHFTHRLSVVAGEVAELTQQLAQLESGGSAALAQRGVMEEGRRPKVAFLCTGQGSQYAGMARELYAREPVFRAVLDRCDACLRNDLERPLLEVIFGADDGSLDKTGYTQPALYALEAGLAALWSAWGVTPDIVMGHSVGEYAAAHIAGVFGLEDGLKLIAARARLMQALPAGGGMAAVMASAERVQALLKGRESELSLAAINGSESVVVSGPSKTLQDLCTSLEGQGIKTRPLAVSHAFHSALMEPMLDAFRNIARGIAYQAPKLALISNVSGELAGAAMADADYWVRHVRAPVQFAAGVQTLMRSGATVCVEIGPKPVLLGMARACLPDETISWLPSLRPGQPEPRSLLESLGALYVRGATVDWRGVYAGRGYRKVVLPTYAFQRKRYWPKHPMTRQRVPENSAQSPIVRFLEQGDSAGLAGLFRSSGSFNRGEQEILPSVARWLVDRHQRDRSADIVSDWLYGIEWNECRMSASPTVKSEPGYWLVLSGSRLGAQLARIIAANHQGCITVLHGPQFASPDQGDWCVDPSRLADFERLLDEGQARAGLPLLGILHLWPAESPATGTFDAADFTGCCSLLHLVQSLHSKRIVPKSGIWTVTRGMFPAAGKEKSRCIGHAPLAGLAQTIALEHGELWGGIIDLAPEADDSEAERLFNRITDPQGETRVAFRGGMQFAPRLVRLGSIETGIFSAHPEGCYLITGGTGALGLRIARWLAERGARHLVLVARGAGMPELRAAIRHMQESGVSVSVERADVADRQALKAVFETIEARAQPLRGVIHAAGTLDDAVLQKQDWVRFSRVLAPKVAGSWNLHELTAGMSLDFFVMFSSAASVFGAAGQGNYAAGNAFLDALAHYRRSCGLPGLSINWGPWADVGMAAQLEEKDRLRMTTRGIGMIDVDTGLAALERMIASQAGMTGAAQQIAVPIAWAELSRTLSGSSGLSFLSKIADFEPAANETRQTKSDVLGRITAAESGQQVETILTYLKSLTASTLKVDETRVTGDSDLTELGIDSLMIMEMLECIKRDFDLMVYPREVYSNPRLADLAGYLARELENSRMDTNQVDSGVKQRADRQDSRVVTISDPRAGLPADFKPLDPMVFLLSAPRSGSTLLRVMLAGHPALFSPPELHLLPYVTMAQRHEGLKESYLEQGLQRALMEINGVDADHAQAVLDDLIDHDAPIVEVYATLQKLIHPRILVDKSPTYALDPMVLERAEAMFSGARYIHLVRHPASSIESFARMRMDKLMGPGSTDPYGTAEEVWLNGNRNIAHFLRTISADRVHRIRFEDLVSNSERALRTLSDFLGLEFDAAMVDPYGGQRMTDGIRATSRPIGDPNFLQRREVETDKAAAWMNIRLPRPPGPDTVKLAESLDYVVKTIASGTTPCDLDVMTSPMTERFLEARGLRFCLCGWGEENAPLIVLLHGILDQGASWEQVAIRLACEGYRVIAPDLRGHGRSSAVGAGGSYSLLDFVADLDVILGQLTDRPFTLVGHSLGTILSAMYAGTHPDRVTSLVLVETVLPVNSGNDAGWNQIKTQIKYLSTPPVHGVMADIDVAAEKLRQMTPNLSARFSRRLATRITKPSGNGLIWSWDPLLGTRAGISGGITADKAGYLQLLGKIEMPLTLLFGDSSRLNRPADIAILKAAMGHAQQYTLKGGHQLHFDAPVDVSYYIVQAAAQSVDVAKTHLTLEAQN